MHKRSLGRTGISTSRLGFGCANLSAFANRREAIRILERAFALGITHFDVARMYGWGRAEGILGEFLRGKRDQVTVATKFGIQPPSGVLVNRRVIDLAKRLLRPFPGLRRRVRRSATNMGAHGVFTPQEAVQSLELSLRELGTDFVDLFLLHEPTLADAEAEPLIETLQKLVSRGTIRCFGLAARFQDLEKDAGRVPPAYRVLQTEDNALGRNISKLAHRENFALITHSIFQPLNLLREAIGAQPSLTRKYSLETNLDVADSTVLGSLLFQYALKSNSEGVVLFTSASFERVGSNVSDAESCPYTDQQVSGFVEFVQALVHASPSRVAS